MHIAVKNFNSILEAVIASERWLSLHSCTAVPGKCRSHITHHLYSELKKTILWKLNACMDDLVLFEDLDETKNSHLFHVFGLLLIRAYRVKGQMTKIKRGPLRASHMLASSNVPWQCFPGWATPLFPASKGGSSTPAFGKPLLWGTDLLPWPWNGRRTDTQGKRKCTHPLRRLQHL